MEGKWLLLSFHLPAEPSGPRVAVWRQLQKLGSIKLEGGVWLLPYTDPLAAEIEQTVSDIRRHSGAAHVFVVQSLRVQEEETLRERFNKARQQEYAEVMNECQKLLAHIEREMRQENYAFAEVEELEEDMEKVQRWSSQVRARDVFGLPTGQTVEETLQKCRQLMEGFTRKAYEAGGEGIVPEP
jgi:DNA-binding transcriptional regulator PaaX